MIKTLLKKYKSKYLRRKLNRYRPKIVSGYVRKKDQKLLLKTRISNHSFIDYEHNLDIADNVFIGHFNYIEASNGIKIEEGCQFTNYITVTTHSSHNSIRLYGNYYKGADMIGYIKGSVEIGKFTFIGPHSVIMPNTKIGKGSLISAYSYVQGNFPDFSIIRGNPAKIIGDTRKLDEEIIKQNPELKPFYDEWIFR